MSIINPQTGQPYPDATQATEITPTLYFFAPDDSITVQEVAFMVQALMKALGFAITQKAFEEMPAELKRHFVNFNPNGEAAN